MRTILSISLVTMAICLTQSIPKYEKKFCPKPKDSGPTKCEDMCMTDEDCQQYQSESICCPGFCFEEYVDSVRAYNACFSPDPCATAICENGAMCIRDGKRYQCYCQKGYTGAKCDSQINECASNPCQNDGTCHDLVNNYTCCCQPGYIGTNCEQRTSCPSPCSPENCPKFKGAKCRIRFFIEGKDGTDIDVTESCFLP